MAATEDQAASPSLATATKAYRPSQYQTKWAIGKKTTISHRVMKTMSEENFTRSAIAPTMSAAVMQANDIWKATKVSSGITTPVEKVAATVVASTPERNILEK